MRASWSFDLAFGTFTRKPARGWRDSRMFASDYHF